MNKYIAITTTGTALLTNTSRYFSIKTGPLTEIPDDKVQEFINSNIRDNTEQKISAEINSTLQLDRYLREKHDTGIEKVHLILSDTDEMKKERPHLERYFSKRGFEVDSAVIDGLQYHESKFKMNGLRSLINTLSDLIDDYKNKGYTVVMNATGGFKAEIAFATVIAQLQHIESYYIYESFNEIIPLPHLPLNLDVEYWSKFNNLFDEFSNNVSGDKADKLLKDAPEGFRFLVEQDAEKTIWRLNLAGVAFYINFEKQKEIFLREVDQKRVFKKTGETTLWNKTGSAGGIESLKDIPDNDVRKLLERVVRFRFVNKIELADFHEVGKSQGDVRLEFKRKDERSGSHIVQYEIRCRDGRQNINIQVEKGFCDDLISMLGKKVYP